MTDQPVAPLDGHADAPRSRLDWRDFQEVLAVARHGSVRRASADLAVTHATLLRKLAAIESRLKARLFDRERGRYTLTAAGEQIAQAAAGFEPLAVEAELRVLGQDLRPSGHVRVAVAGIVTDHLLPPLLSQFALAFPDVALELVSSRDPVSLARREADVAIRIADQVPEWLVGRRLAEIDFKVYTLKRQGLEQAVRSIEVLSGERRWIGLERDARDLKFDRWLHAQVPESSVVLRVDNFGHALTMVRAGLGVALLPSFVEATCADLHPLSAAIPALRTPLWLVTHQELRHAMRVKVLMRAFGPALQHALRAG